jgi:predicted metal-dependent hydrolase
MPDLNHIFSVFPGTIRAEFYPYTQVKHTIRKRDGIILIRISDTFQNAPQNVLLSLGRILLAKLNKTPVSPEDRKVYHAYVTSEKMQKTASSLLKSRTYTRKKIKGRHKNLNNSFKRINNSYFNGKMKKPVLTWSTRRARRTFGKYDVDQDTIIISPILDSPDIPDELLDFIMYHELLHKKHGIIVKGTRRRMHTPEFKKDEKKFKNYKKMKVLMRKLAKA